MKFYKLKGNSYLSITGKKITTVSFIASQFRQFCCLPVIICSISPLQHTAIFSCFRPPSAVYYPTTSFNKLLFQADTAAPFCYIISKFYNRSIPELFPLFGRNSSQFCDKNLTHPKKLTKDHLLYLSSAHSLQTEDTHSSSTNPIIIHPSSSPDIPLRLNPKHHPA